MQLEFHQLDRRGEHLRVQHGVRQKRWLASLATSGQQTPIVVVAVADPADRYLVLDGYQRVAALEPLGRDTVEAVIWAMSEAEALVLDRSLRWSERESALEEGWLLAELEQRFGYDLEELARRFDRSVSWVSRRLALVELLPESLQQPVRTGEISTQGARKDLVPVARSSREDCPGLAAAIVRHKLTNRQAGELYAAWRQASAKMRLRILEQPQLFFKAQREIEPPSPASSLQELVRDLEIVGAIVRRANRRLLRSRAELERMDGEQSARVRQQLDHILAELRRLAAQIPPPAEEAQPRREDDVEPKSTNHDSGTVFPGNEPTRDRASGESQPVDGRQSAALQLGCGSAPIASRESRTLPATDP
jgi:ParB family transcriptional regulator, chromosome partitioning protein